MMVQEVAEEVVEPQDILRPKHERPMGDGILGPLLTDTIMKSILSIMVRPNECDQSYHGAWAVRQWYERNLRADRIITKGHQEDVALLLKVIDGEASDEDIARLKMIRKQFVSKTV